MTQRKSLVFFFYPALLLLLTFSCVGAEAKGRREAQLDHPLKIEAVQPQRYIEIMRPHLRPGSVVVDIGAGTGNFAFLFAETVGETGKVYATDADPEMIKHLTRRLKKSPHKNVFVVAVQADGPDPFYKKHRFDVIFMARMYRYLFDAQTYLRELRPSLAKGGRLYILESKNEWDVTRDRIDDLKKIVRKLASSGKDYPFFVRLDEETKRFVSDWDGKEVPPAVEESILASFNRMIPDASLYRDLRAYHYDKERPHKFWEENLKVSFYALARWLIAHLEESQAFDEGKVLSETDSEQVRMLNRMLILGTFGRQPTVPNVAEQWEANIFLFQKKSVVSTLERAGYRLVREYDDSPKYFFLEFLKEG